MKKLVIFFLILNVFSLSAQSISGITIQDDAKVGFINTGSGANINVNQVFGKSPEYAELKKTLETLEADIQKKVAECADMEKDNLPDKYREGCRNEVIKLNARRDSVQKIEIRFRQDVIRLAETFSTIPINSERLRLAKQFFDEGKIREADQILNAKEMREEGDALLEKKGRELQERQKTDSLLRIKADEFALKAKLKATEFSEPFRFDSVQIYFEKSRQYTETSHNLWSYAEFLYYENQSQRCAELLERALNLSHSDQDRGYLNMNLGIVYSDLRQIMEAESRYLRSLNIFEQLSKKDSTQFEPALAKVYLNFGKFYRTQRKMMEAKKMYESSLAIYEKLAKVTPKDHEPNLARIGLSIGVFYFSNDSKDEKIEKIYLNSYEIFDRLAKTAPNLYEADLANTCMNLGLYYKVASRLPEAERMYLNSFGIYERLSNNNPAQFKPDLAIIAMNFGAYYRVVSKNTEAENMLKKAMEVYEELVKINPIQYEFLLASSCMNLGNFYANSNNIVEAKKCYNQALGINEKLAANNPPLYEPHLAKLYINIGYNYQNAGKMQEAEKVYNQSIEIYKRLIVSNREQFTLELATAYGNLSWCDLFNKKYSEATSNAEKGLSLDSTEAWLYMNLGHSWLFRHNWKKAKNGYEKYLAWRKDTAAAKADIGKDLDDLEAAGITCPKMAKARAWLKE